MLYQNQFVTNWDDQKMDFVTHEFTLWHAAFLAKVVYMIE